MEGGELDVLEGAGRLLRRRSRPVEDRRTKMWRYRAKEIIQRLEDKGFAWRSITELGQLERFDTSGLEREGNYVAVPTQGGDARPTGAGTQAATEADGIT